MAEYLERKTLIKFVKRNTPNFNGETTMRCVARSIRNAPAIEAKPIVHAHWIERYLPKEFILTGEEKLFICSNCTAKFETVENSNYCPYCGAQMDEEE